MTASLLLLASVFLFVTGCDESGPVRYDISGEVTFDGNPIPVGVLIFKPDRSAGNDGPQGFVKIKDGHFSTASGYDGKGIGGGAYIVEIQGFDGVPYEGVADGQMLFMPLHEKLTLPEDASVIAIAVTRSAGGPRVTVDVQPQ